jgi:tRNA-dihydrouridine synthase B
LGWDHDSIHIVEVAERLQDVGVQALSIHGRTRKQMYTGEADWSYIAEVKNHPRIHIPIFGNGDIDSPEKAVEYKNKYGVDGIMIGRAAIGYPWIFREIKHFMATGKHLPPPTVDERVNTAIQHLKTAIAWKGTGLGVLETRRHYGSYFRGFREIKPYRMKLVNTLEPEELFDTLELIREKYNSDALLLEA